MWNGFPERDFVLWVFMCPNTITLFFDSIFASILCRSVSLPRLPRHGLPRRIYIARAITPSTLHRYHACVFTSRLLRHSSEFHFWVITPELSRSTTHVNRVITPASVSSSIFTYHRLLRHLSSRPTSPLERHTYHPTPHASINDLYRTSVLCVAQRYNRRTETRPSSGERLRTAHGGVGNGREGCESSSANAQHHKITAAQSAASSNMIVDLANALRQVLLMTNKGGPIAPTGTYESRPIQIPHKNEMLAWSGTFESGQSVASAFRVFQGSVLAWVSAEGLMDVLKGESIPVVLPDVDLSRLRSFLWAGESR